MCGDIVCYRSGVATHRMLEVMRGKYRSRRHELFLVRGQRERCSGSGVSELYQLSNSSFLGGGGEKDTGVLDYLRKFFNDHFHEADERVKQIGTSEDFIYASCVLFPETFIHKHQV